MVRGTHWKARGVVLVVRILPWIRFFCNVHSFRVPRSWTDSVQMKSSMTFIPGNMRIEIDKDTFKSREVKSVKECALALSKSVRVMKFSFLISAVRMGIESKEHTNYARLCRIVIELCSGILRCVLSFFIVPSCLRQAVTKCVALNNLSTQQWKLIHVAKIEGYSNFDITLLYSLLRNLNLSGLSPPPKGWGRQPGITSTSLADDVERIRILHNEIYGHKSTAKLSDPDFKQAMTILSHLCGRMDKEYSKFRYHEQAFQSQLRELETCLMDEQLRKKYINIVANLDIENENFTDVPSQAAGKN